MKNKFIMLTIVISLFSCQKPSNDLTEVQRSSIAEDINRLTKATYEAGSQKDAEKVYTFFSDNTTGVLSGAVIESWKEHKDQGIAFYKTLNKVEYSIINSKVDVLSNNVAIVYGQYKFIAIDTAGNEMNDSSGWTWVWNRQNDNWKIVHVHTSKISNTEN